MSTMSDDAFERAVVRACLRKATSWSPSMLLGTDAVAVSFGPTLDEIVHEAGVPPKQVKRQLKTLESSGRLLVDGAGTKRTWWVVGLIDSWRLTEAVVIPASVALPFPLGPFKAATPHLPVAREAWWEVLGVNQDDSFRECTAAYEEIHARLLGDESPEAPALIARLNRAYDNAAQAHDVQVTE